MINNNKLIAEFMGVIKYSEQHDGMYCVETMELDDFPILFKDGSYDSSWDWLMPVANEIIKSRDEQNADWDLTDLKYALQTTNIELVYKAVVEFIKEYNVDNADSEDDACDMLYGVDNNQ